MTAFRDAAIHNASGPPRRTPERKAMTLMQEVDYEIVGEDLQFV